MMNKPWKLILLLVGIFVAGGATGVLLTMSVGRSWLKKRSLPEQWAPLHLRVLTKRLDLSGEQVEQLRPIVRRNIEELERIRSQWMKDGRAVMERMQGEIAEKLTPEQRRKFEEFNRESRERFRQFTQNRSGRPPPEPGSGGPRPEGPPPGEAPHRP